MCQPNEVQSHVRDSTLYDQLPSSSPVQGWCAGSWNAGHAQNAPNNQDASERNQCPPSHGRTVATGNRGWWRCCDIRRGLASLELGPVSDAATNVQVRGCEPLSAHHVLPAGNGANEGLGTRRPA